MRTGQLSSIDVVVLEGLYAPLRDREFLLNRQHSCWHGPIIGYEVTEWDGENCVFVNRKTFSAYQELEARAYFEMLITNFHKPVIH